MGIFFKLYIRSAFQELKVVQWLGNRVTNKNRRVAAYFILTPWILFGLFFEVLYQIFKLTRVRKSEKDMSFDHELAIVAIVKNETPYIIEWIEFHLLVGISIFYIYDNESEDGLKDLLQPYIDRGIVVYKEYPGVTVQYSAYSDALQRYAEKVRYMAFIDLDEFIVPNEFGKNIPEIITSIVKEKKNAGGIGVCWNVYGSSGHKTKPEGLVTENYLNRQNYEIDFPVLVKTICNPRLAIRSKNAHHPEYLISVSNIDESGRPIFDSHAGYTNLQLRINHYVTKSEEECRKKIERGRADINTKRSSDFFQRHDINEVYDDRILPYIPKLKENVKKFDSMYKIKK